MTRWIFKRLRLALFAVLALVIAPSITVAQQATTSFAANAAGQQRVLGTLRTANFNTTADQAIPILSTITKYAITAVYVTNCSANLTTAVGGFYNATAKGGVAIVANSQVYTALTTGTVLLPATVAVAGLATAFTATTVYLSLTIAQGGAATCDVYIVGVDLT